MQFDTVNFASGKVIVALHRNSNGLDASAFDIRRIFNQVDYEKADVLFHPKKGKNESDIGVILLLSMKNKSKWAVMNAIEKLALNPNVVYAEPDYLADPHVIPNDPYFDLLWGAKRVKAPAAWNTTTGSAGIVVGVLDSGIDHRHPDIRANMWSSPDGQLADGWNFVDNTGNSMDTTGHGTHVAGTIGAVGNNCIGIAGICWHVQLAAFKIGNRLIDLAAAIAAIDFANRYDIPILNNSWGGRAYSEALKFAIGQYDGLFVASAGNSGADNDLLPVYPASYDSDNIISVAATNPDDALARFSNYGAQSVDIAAPGVDIFSLSLHDEYSDLSGTSMSAPHVAGAAALLKAYRPNLSVSEIKNIILSSADRRPQLSGKIATGGLLNVNAMLEMTNCFTTCSSM